MSGWTPAMFRTLFEITAASSSLSVIGSTFILTTFAMFPESRRGVSKLLMYLSISDLLGSLSFLAGAGHTLNGGDWKVDTTSCQIQAFALQMFSLSTALWSLFIGVHLFRVFIMRKSSEDLNFTLKFYHVIAWGFSLLLGIIALFAELYGPAGGWCWIPAKHAIFQQIFFYFFVYIIFLTLVGIYVKIGLQIYKQMEETATNLEYSHRTKKRQEAKRDKVMRKLLFFPLVFIITWLPGITNRMSGLFGNPPNYALFVGHVTFTPLQGFLNAIVYGLTGNIGAMYMKKFKHWTGQESTLSNDNIYHTGSGSRGGRSAKNISGDLSSTTEFQDNAMTGVRDVDT